MDTNIERWCSMKEITEYLGVSRDTVLNWIEKRNMPAAKIGRLWKFKISEVDAWIKEVNTDAFWEANNILLFEKVRKELRGLMQFLVEIGPVKNPIITCLTDPIIGEQEGVQLEPPYDFEDYRAKVDRYVNENGNTLAIF